VEVDAQYADEIKKSQKQKKKFINIANLYTMAKYCPMIEVP